MNITDLAPGKCVWDTVVKGLHLRCFANGNISWYLKYCTKTQIQRRPKIGAYPQFSIDQARDIARTLLADVALGKDPSGMWRAGRREITVNELYELVLKKHWSKDRYQKSGWAKNAAGYHKNQIKDTIGNRRISELTPGIIRAWHRSMEDIPFAANRALAILGRLFSWCEETEMRPLGTNPCKLVSYFVEPERTRFAEPWELKAVIETLEKSKKDYPGAVALIYTVIFTGARLKSLYTARHSQLRKNVLSFEGKTSQSTGHDEQVVIPPNAMKWIEELPPYPGGFIFGVTQGELGRIWRKLKTRAGLAKSDLTMHDFRRTFATTAVTSGVDMRVIGDMLNHRSLATTQKYARVVPAIRERGLKTTGDELLRMIEGEE